MKSLPLQLGQGHGEMYKTSAFYEEVLTKLQIYCSSKGPVKCLLSVSICSAILIQIYAAVSNEHILKYLHLPSGR